MKELLLVSLATIALCLSATGKRTSGGYPMEGREKTSVHHPWWNHTPRPKNELTDPQKMALAQKIVQNSSNRTLEIKCYENQIWIQYGVFNNGSCSSWRIFPAPQNARIENQQSSRTGEQVLHIHGDFQICYLDRHKNIADMSTEYNSLLLINALAKKDYDSGYTPFCSLAIDRDKFYNDFVSLFDCYNQKKTNSSDKPTVSLEQKLTTLKKLKDEELITESEYQTKKETLLNEL